MALPEPPLCVRRFDALRLGPPDAGSKVTESLRAGIGHQADQQEVWQEQTSRASRFQMNSETGAMHDVHEHHGEDLERTWVALAPLRGQVGALVYLAGSWIGLTCSRRSASSPGPGRAC
jgi:hypothetical protein